MSNLLNSAQGRGSLLNMSLMSNQARFHISQEHTLPNEIDSVVSEWVLRGLLSQCSETELTEAHANSRRLGTK